MAFRTLEDEGGPALPEEQMRAYAANFEVWDPALLEGEGDFRPATPADRFPAVTSAGAPDLSLMAKARKGFEGPYGLGINQLLNGMGGPEYIASLLSGVLNTSGRFALTAAVVLGGVKSISKACSVLVPVMAIVYVLGCLAILIMNAAALPEALVTIWNGAFNFESMAGGFTGSALAAAMRFGIARGLFSNESGLGSAPIVAAAALQPSRGNQF